MIILFVVVSFITIIALQKIFLHNSLEHMHYKSSPSLNLAEPGEKFEIISEVHNAKWLPVLYVELAEKLPRGAQKHDESDGEQAFNKFFMFPYQKVNIHTTISIQNRGRHMLEGATLFGGDFFGIESLVRWKKAWGEVIVIPRKIKSPSLDKVLGGFLGDISVRRFIMPDPVLSVGAREYTGREPQKDISWVHSVRAGRLLVKQYDHTLELAVTVILNLETEHTNEAALEQCFSLTRSICEELERKRIKYSFLTNAVAAGAIGRGNDLRDGLGSSHLGAVLECLGRAIYSWRGSFNSLLQKALHRAEQGRYHIIITPEAVRTAETVTINRLRATTGSEAIVITPEGGI